MVKVLLLSFEQYFGPFIMLLVKGSSETELLRYLPNHVFGSPEVQKLMRSDGNLFFENFQN